MEELTQQEKEDVEIGVRKDGMKFRIRNDRNRFFFPEEWDDFYSRIRDRNKFIFDLLESKKLYV